ncbi:uncharacterized protein [Amphiura filiformis]|uniref:uncharacterized protein n=1 Tax=Amphiura filiformis TaxID=82378 RepID=UPI003B221A2B
MGSYLFFIPCILLVCISLWSSTSAVDGGNFVRVEKKLGERVISVRFGSISAVEVTASDGPQIDIIIRQITDGHRLVQSIYDDQMVLRECKVDRDETTIANFLDKINILAQEDGDTKSVLDLSYEYNSTNIIDTRPILEERKTDLSKQLQSILDIKSAKLLCRNLGRSMKENLKRRRGQEEHKAGEEELRRNKRDLLIFPGTLWCGVGDVADGDYDNLGEAPTVDSCCRKHDHCPDYIESFETKYDIFNYRMYTISNCQCDNEFLQCLTNTGNSLGYAVARAYFNVLGCSCFKVVTEERCVEFGWWGRCRRMGEEEVGLIDHVGPVESIETSHR